MPYAFIDGGIFLLIPAVPASISIGCPYSSSCVRDIQLITGFNCDLAERYAVYTSSRKE